MKTYWHIRQPSPEAVAVIRKQLNCGPAIACILANRNLGDPAKIDAFFNSSLASLHSPFELKDMQPAVERIAQALKQNEKILLFGDYDVDGTTATTILYLFLRQINADVAYFIPNRLTEGYGLQDDHIDRVALAGGYSLIITADCGISSHSAIGKAAHAGIDVIVTDHHKAEERLPPAMAVVNPNRPDCTSGLTYLAGVGVAFYLLIGLRKHLRERAFWGHRPEPNLKDLCDLVAIGTVADVVPLIADNRILTQTGFANMRKGTVRPGIKALFDVCKCDAAFVDAEDIAFKIGPRINAAGRMADASGVVDLFLAATPQTAKSLARQLERFNKQRKATEQEILEQIGAHLRAHLEELQNRSLVLAQENWHQGVLGIVAARLVERYHRPVVLIGLRNGIGRGSARGIPAMNLHAALQACSEELLAFGGHALAAGMKIEATKLEPFKAQFETVVRTMTQRDDIYPTLTIDCELSLNAINDQLVDDLEHLKPFGESNPKPLFMARDVTVVNSKVFGDNHRRMVLAHQDADRPRHVAAIWFNAPGSTLSDHFFKRVAFYLDWNRWNGQKNIQMTIKAVSNEAA